MLHWSDNYAVCVFSHLHTGTSKVEVKEEFANRRDCLTLRVTDSWTGQVIEHFAPGRRRALKGVAFKCVCLPWLRYVIPTDWIHLHRARILWY